MRGPTLQLPNTSSWHDTYVSKGTALPLPLALSVESRLRCVAFRLCRSLTPYGDNEETQSITQHESGTGNPYTYTNSFNLDLSSLMLRKKQELNDTL